MDHRRNQRGIRKYVGKIKVSMLSRMKWHHTRICGMLLKQDKGTSIALKTYIRNKGLKSVASPYETTTTKK